jgi:hypothetical protein
MTDPERDYFLDRIHQLEQSQRLWRRLTFGLAGVLVLLVVLAAGSSVALHVRALRQERAAVRAMQEADRAMQEAEQARQKLVKPGP